MMYVNGLSACVFLLTLLISRSLIPALGSMGSHPRLMWDALVLSVADVGSQFFIFSMVKEFGALVFAATLNVRQVVSVLISSNSLNHFITGYQLVGLILVFTVLFYRSWKGLQESASAKEEKTPLMPELPRCFHDPEELSNSEQFKDR
mmetsp:Transcript_15920/g.50009  ORF Transcript_15920/g.50009 Transcript_15920/m.50009 type:complete len:148 (+) Transcript_15920:3-446(+)